MCVAIALHVYIAIPRIAAKPELHFTIALASYITNNIILVKFEVGR